MNSPVLRTKSRSYLLVERDLLAAEQLQARLSQALSGAVFHIAGEFRQAQPMLDSVQPDVVVLDLDLSDGVILDFATEAARRNPPVPVVVVARRGDDERILPALRAGAAGFLLRNDSTLTLGQQVRAALSGVWMSAPFRSQAEP